MTDIMEQQPKASSTRQEREAAFDAHVESNLKRNYISHFLHGMLGLTGFRLIYAPTFIPAYVQMLTGSTMMVGLGQSLLQFGAIVSPLVAANRMETKDYVLPMSVRAGTLVRLQILGLALSGFFMSGMPLVVATFVFLFLMGIFQGMQRVAFALVMAKVIPISRRGRLQAWRNLVGGAIAALLSYSAGKYLIQHNVFGNGYATTFLAAFALTSLGLLALQFGMVEPRAPTVRIEEPLLQRLRQFPVLLEDRDYRNFVVAQGLAICARVSAPFYILYAQKLMPLSGETIGTDVTDELQRVELRCQMVRGAIGRRIGRHRIQCETQQAEQIQHRAIRHYGRRQSDAIVAMIQQRQHRHRQQHGHKRPQCQRERKRFGKVLKKSHLQCSLLRPAPFGFGP